MTERRLTRLVPLSLLDHVAAATATYPAVQDTAVHRSVARDSAEPPLVSGSPSRGDVLLQGVRALSFSMVRKVNIFQFAGNLLLFFSWEAVSLFDKGRLDSAGSMRQPVVRLVLFADRVFGCLAKGNVCLLNLSLAEGRGRANARRPSYVARGRGPC